MPDKSLGVLRQRNKCALRHILGLVRIVNHPHGGGINKIDVSTDQFGKGRFGPAGGIGGQQLLVSLSVHS